MQIIQTVAPYAISVVLADLASGLVHWAEDTYLDDKTPLFGRWLGTVASENRMHHTRPRAFLEKTWWQSSYDLVLAALLVIMVAWALDCLTGPVWLFAVLTANANQIHKWAHQNRQEKGWVVDTLQRLRILQTPREHGNHHRGEKNSHYCAITNFTNSALETIRFWRSLEWLLAKTIGLKPMHY